MPTDTLINLLALWIMAKRKTTRVKEDENTLEQGFEVSQMAIRMRLRTSRKRSDRVLADPCTHIPTPDYMLGPLKSRHTLLQGLLLPKSSWGRSHLLSRPSLYEFLTASQPFLSLWHICLV